MRTALFSDRERTMVIEYLETSEKGKGFWVLAYRTRRHHPKIKEDFDLMNRLLDKLELRIDPMKAMPTNWHAHAVVNDKKYGCDGDYNIWDLEKEEKIYSYDGLGEIDLPDVIRGKVLWENSEVQFTFQDFVYEILETLP